MPRTYMGNQRFEEKLLSGEDLTRSEFLTYLRLRSQDFPGTHPDASKPLADWWAEFGEDFLEAT